MKLKTERIIYSALFTAVLVITAQLTVIAPLGIPITLQTFAVALCGYMLSAKWSVASILTYIVVGAVGLPVFSGFRGGIQHLIGPTGGFIVGFIFLSLFCSLNFIGAVKKIISGLSGLIICHIIGIFQYAFITGNNLKISFITISLPFLLKDIFCVVLAYILSIKIIEITSKKRS